MTRRAFCGAICASAVIGCAVAFGYRRDWAWAAWAGGGVLLAACFWVYGELTATAEAMRRQPEEPVAMTSEEAAAVLAALARDIDAELAGGVPAKAVAQAAADRARRYGREVRDAIRAAARMPLP